MKRILLSLISLVVCSLSFAQEIHLDETTKEVCNKVILGIYNEILKSKDKYRELSHFDEKALYENKYGIYTISYQNDDPNNNTRTGPYEFLITIVGIDDTASKPAGFEDKHYGFPIIGLRTSSFIRRDFKFHRYDIDAPIKKYNDLLYDYQQKFHPLQVILKSDKETFKVDERIEFEVIVKNAGTKNYMVKSLGEKSVFFTIDDQEWGTRSAAAKSVPQNVRPPPDGSIKRTFKGHSFSTPREVEIFCTYNVAYKGIFPFGRLKVKIVE